MTTIYKHATGTSCIEAVKRWDGGTDIMVTCGICTAYEEMVRHTLPINECDRFGAVLCKDIIDNYTGHNSNLKDKIADLEDEARNVRYDNATLRDEKAELELRIRDLRDHVRERNTTMSECIVEHNQHTHQLYARIEYLEAINKGLESDLSNIRIANTLHKERWGERAGELDDCKKAFFNLLDERSELEATNRGLEKDVSNLRMANSLYRKRWNEHNEDAPSIPYSIYIHQGGLNEDEHT